MDGGLNPSEIPVILSVAPGYPPAFTFKRLWCIVACQMFVCVTSSVWISYFLCKKFFAVGGITWKKAIEVMGPISKRLQNLEKERTVWHYYLEWIEDYCSVYYGLLNYLNTAASNLDKLCTKTFSWKTLSESSGLTSQWEGESQDGREGSSEGESDKGTPSAGAKAFSSFAKVLSNMKLSNNTDFPGGTSWDNKDLDFKKGTTAEETTSSEAPDSDCSTTRKIRKKSTKRD